MQPLREYRWSSFEEYLKVPSRRPAWVRVDRVFGDMRISRDSTTGRQRFEAEMEQRRGEEQFRIELLEQVHKRAGVHQYGEEIVKSAETKAGRIIAEELAKLGCEEKHLGQRRRGDAGKVRIARRLRRETTVSKRWIAQHLSKGSVSNATFCLTAAGKQLRLSIEQLDPMQIWENSSGGVIYDNQPGDPDTADATNSLGGNIVIHQP